MKPTRLFNESAGRPISVMWRSHLILFTTFVLGSASVSAGQGLNNPAPHFEYGAAVIEAKASGDEDRYRAALLQFAAAAEIGAKGFLGRAAEIDAALAYYKLSKLEKDLGREAEASRYLGLALDRCRSGGKECSAEGLAELAQRISETDGRRGFDW